MSWMDSIGTAVDAASESAGSLFESAASYATDAFGWLNDNPAAANVLGGLATGAASYFAQQDALDQRFKFERDLYREKRDDAMINPGTIENYGTHVGTAKKGLLSNGMIAGGQ
ncbi:hypothetical protein MHM84_01270 [Halomonas sp. McH1-25]|uniref:hypothetical protein n=1 Tax=unclassified Halomonas TaxID=2609666 RepID=UPI001EF3EAA6|nr:MULTISPECIES: hypothetical protein [unclassified Halomonas]MCG7598412.1 hypothetical protein [Halomonas sp. McH1-25]MCP1342646.1 hypothetical protein [Halomonas sp. FL8]MCP1361727.1 hypothetical protein [Halomonas sp. BBD45]MCP1365848.1 hypothetical protein [Halomonas sp. BBD48]